MFVRIVRPQIKSGQAEEAAKRWEAHMGPKAKSNPNFQRGFFAASADRTAVAAVTLWDQVPDEEMTRQIQQEISTVMEGLMSGPPTTEDFEVLAQI